MIATLAAGALAGLLASAHCAIMCGPLAAVAHRAASRAPLPYYAARIATYAALGAAAGLGGQAIALTGVGASLSLVAAAVLLLYAVNAMRPARPVWFTRKMSAVIGRTMAVSSAFVRQHHVTGMALLGVLNGLLPCGLVYAALAASLGLADPMASAVMMAGFGLGTAPALLLIGRATHAIAPAARARWRHAVPVSLVVMATMLIARALSAPAAHVH